MNSHTRSHSGHGFLRNGIVYLHGFTHSGPVYVHLLYLAQQTQGVLHQVCLRGELFNDNRVSQT